MSATACGTVRDRLPEWAAGLLPLREAGELEAHLATCEACRGEAEVVRMLLEVRPEPSSDLAVRITAALAEAGAPGGLGRARRAGAHRLLRGLRPAWALPAAAVLVLALGTALFLDREGGDESPPTVAAVDLLADSWLWEESMVAGAPTLESLSDEELARLLEELEG